MKYYVVWAGNETGIFDNWIDCKVAVDGYPGARYKSFPSREEAIAAYRGNPDEHLAIFKAIAAHEPRQINYEAFPEIDLTAIAVDAACSHNPGPVEYQGVYVATGQRIFHVGPLPDGTNNLGEFLGLVHALALLDKEQRYDTTIYSDSRTAISWVKNRKARTTIKPNGHNTKILQMVARAEQWLQTHTLRNRILKWDTERWGEIPADFGRK